MQKKEPSILRLQLLFAGGLLALLLLVRFLFPDGYDALRALYAELVDGPPLFTLDEVKQVVRQAVALLSEPR